MSKKKRSRSVRDKLTPTIKIPFLDKGKGKTRPVKNSKKKIDPTCEMCGKTAIETGGIFKKVKLKNQEGKEVVVKNVCRKCVYNAPKVRSAFLAVAETNSVQE